jgi:hypothetical protein
VPLKLPKRLALARRNTANAKATWPADCSRPVLAALRELTTTFGFSVARGEIRLLSGGWYVTHCGLLCLAQRRQCRGISIEPVLPFSDPDNGRWVFKAIVHKTGRSKGFVGYGDADPSNVSPMVRGAEMRIAETRAVNRALRKAYGIGLCSVEELGSFTAPKPAPQANPAAPVSGNGNGFHYSQPGCGTNSACWSGNSISTPRW